MIAARVLALALLASVFRFCMALQIIIKIISCNIKLTAVEWKQFRSSACLAYVLIFDYHNSRDKLSGKRYIYYIIVFVENFGLTCAWYFTCPDGLWYKSYALHAEIICFFVGISIMCAHYHWMFSKFIQNLINAAEANDSRNNIVANGHSTQVANNEHQGHSGQVHE
ncbi:unnamed protein product, partial [Medioppia subpectinata]